MESIAADPAPNQAPSPPFKPLPDPRQLLCPVPVASPKNVTEIWDRLFDSDWRDFTYDFDVVDRIGSAINHPVYKFSGHHRPPLLEPALQRPKLFGPDGAGVIAHQYSQDLGSAGVWMILQVGEDLGPDMFEGIRPSPPSNAALSFWPPRGIGLSRAP